MELPELAVLRQVVARYAEVLTTLELVPGEQPLVLPNGDWFPDTFKGDQESLERIVARMQGYAGLEDVEIEARLVGEGAQDASCKTTGCGTGACSTPKVVTEGPRLVSEGDRFRIEMPDQSLGHPIAFTASIARLLGGARLLRAGRTEANGASAELAATALGFGVLLLEASYLYQKSCGGPSVGTATALSLSDLGVPFGLFLAYEGKKYGPAQSELSVTQRALVDEAWALVNSNRALVERLKRAPERVSAGDFSLGSAKSWLVRLFGKKTPKNEADTTLEALEALDRGENLDHVATLLGKVPSVPSRQRPQAAHDDDLKSLVDESLAEMRGSSQRSAAE